MDTYPFVSIVTPTFGRHTHLPLVVHMFLKQDYPQERLELLIYDDTPEPCNDPCLNRKNIRYIHTSKRQPLPAKRNYLNDMARGEIIVAFDDDDYYPPQRVSHAVNAILESGKELAGGTKIYLAHTLTNKAIVVGPFHNNHATNNTFAYTHGFAQRHRYDETDTKNISEERGFTNNFSEPMAQLDPLKTIVCLHHGTNTVDKDIFFKRGQSVGTFTDVVPDEYIREAFKQLHSKREMPNVVVSITGTDRDAIERTVNSLCEQSYPHIDTICVSLPEWITYTYRDEKVSIQTCADWGPALSFVRPFELYDDNDDIWIFIIDAGHILQKDHIKCMVEESQKRFNSAQSVYGLSGANRGASLPPYENTNVKYLHSACGILLHRSCIKRSSFVKYMYNCITQSLDCWYCPDVCLSKYLSIPKVVVCPHHTLNVRNFWFNTPMNTPRPAEIIDRARLFFDGIEGTR